MISKITKIIDILMDNDGAETKKTISIKPIIFIALCICVNIAVTVVSVHYKDFVLGRAALAAVIIAILLMLAVLIVLIVLKILEPWVRSLMNVIDNKVSSKLKSNLPAKIIGYFIIKKTEVIRLLIIGITLVIVIITIGYSVYACRAIITARAIIENITNEVIHE